MKREMSVVLLISAVLSAARADDPPTNQKPQFAGPTVTGFMLPNGWHLTPVGKHLETTDLPLNVIPLKDGKHVLLASSGYNQHDLMMIDVSGEEPKLVSKVSNRQSWYGLAVDKAEGKVWWSGGGQGRLYTYDVKDGKFQLTSPPDPPAGPATSFKSGLALDETKGVLYSLDINSGSITSSPLGEGKSQTKVIGGRPYDVLVGPGGNLLYVSDWTGRQVLAVDPAELRVVQKIPVAEHPNQMALHKDGRLFVACASSNCVSVIDTKRGHVTETIYTSLFPKAPEGSTPDAVALAPDGKTLFVANADNNCVAVIDVEESNKSQVKGFIPTGWYPTAVAVTPDGKNLLVGVGKGLQSKPNPRAAAKEPEKADPTAQRRQLPYPYIGTTMAGALSLVPVPDEAKLKEYTAQVFRNCPYSDTQLTAAPYARKTAIPTKVGEPSPIKYVLYVIKENRTYDQVFGDMPRGNGDKSLVMFGEAVTPNHHKLAGEFVLLDNLYCNGQVSRDGHPWSTMAYHTDYIARDWHLTYSRRKGVDDDEEGNLQKAPSGYLWDACKRAGISYRSYGEYGRRVSDGQGATKMEGRVPGLVGHMSPDFGVPQKGQTGRVRDTDNADVFIKEYDGFLKAGTMPRFIVMSLGEDHTDGTRVGSFTPQACVASNDLALGRIVEHISNGPLWKETAIFVIEDDAQNGPDHVDAHRTVGLVISPFTKRKHLDSTQYATVSMIRTMELILGLPPLSQYDAAARPMFDSFTDVADGSPFAHVPAKIDLNKKNGPDAYGAERSAKMDFSEYDKIDDFELNEILWRSIKGKDAPLPPAVRRAIAFRSLTAPAK